MLPYLGGASQTWNVAMFSYQAMLLVGYLYVHLTTKYFSLKTKIKIQLILLLTSLLTFPIVINSGDIDFIVNYPITWMLGNLAANIALFFILLSANTILIQKLVANSNYASSNNPYKLYSVSNLGSFFALILFPLFLEPNFSVDKVVNLWSVTYIVFIVCFIGAVYFLCKTGYDDSRGAAKGVIFSKEISLFERCRWSFLSFLPSALMLSLLYYISSELSSFPFLWMLILALYLLTFVIAFSGNKTLLQRSVVSLPLVIFITSLLFVFKAIISTYFVAFHLLVFFILCILCHGKLAQSAPDKKDLTEFYIYIALGGMLGGACIVFLVPLLFKTTNDYFILIYMSCLTCVDKNSIRSIASNYKKHLSVLLIFLISSFAVISIDSEFSFVYNFFESIYKLQIDGLKTLEDGERESFQVMVKFAIMVVIFAICIFIYMRNALLVLIFSLLFFVFSTRVVGNKAVDYDLSLRNFYGITKVAVKDDVVLLKSGVTTHGEQGRDGSIIHSYYGLLFDLQDKVFFRDIGVVGLGAGTLSDLAMGSNKVSIDFFEINPQIISVAKNTKYFTYLDRNNNNLDIKLGDGRLLLTKEVDNKYDLLVMDAYSSDSIPFHLVTKEAVDIYLDKIKSGGILLFHASSRYYDLTGVLAAIVSDINAKKGTDYQLMSYMNSVSRWLAVASGGKVAILGGNGFAQVPESNSRPWSDSYTNIFDALVM